MTWKHKYSPLRPLHTYMPNFISIGILVWEELIAQKVPLNMLQKCIFGNIAKNKARNHLEIYNSMHNTTMYLYTKFHINWSISLRTVNNKCKKGFLSIWPKIQEVGTWQYICTLIPPQYTYLSYFMLIHLNIRELGWAVFVFLRG